MVKIQGPRILNNYCQNQIMHFSLSLSVYETVSTRKVLGIGTNALKLLKKYLLDLQWC